MVDGFKFPLNTGGIFWYYVENVSFTAITSLVKASGGVMERELGQGRAIENGLFATSRSDLVRLTEEIER